MNGKEKLSSDLFECQEKFVSLHREHDELVVAHDKVVEEATSHRRDNIFIVTRKLELDDEVNKL